MKGIRRSVLWLLALVPLLQAGCRTHRPPTTSASGQVSPVPQQVSHINLPVTVDLPVLKDAIKAELRSLLDDLDPDEEMFGFHLTNLQAQVNHIDFRSSGERLDLAADISSQFHATKGPLSIPVALDFDAGLRLRPALTINWAVELHAIKGAKPEVGPRSPEGACG